MNETAGLLILATMLIAFAIYDSKAKTAQECKSRAKTIYIMVVVLSVLILADKAYNLHNDKPVQVKVHKVIV